jgi:regulator of protease activity HflC (stomatin/prohibitin superfamily)
MDPETGFSAKIQLYGGIAVIIMLFSLFVAFAAYAPVNEGYVGVEKEWGAVTGERLGPGANFVVPFKDSVQQVEVRPRTYTMSQTRGEGDKSRADAISVKTVNGSTVQVDVTIRYRINSTQADTFVEEWNNERQMEQRLIRPTIRSQLRDEASDIQTTGENAIYTRSGREALSQTARQALLEEFEDEPIELEKVQIRNIDLPKQIDKTLDQKEQAKQQVQVEQEKVRQEEQKAKQEKIAARADAEVIRIKGEALDNNPEVLRQRYIDALENGETVYVVPDDGGTPVLLQPDGGDEGQ